MPATIFANVLDHAERLDDRPEPVGDVRWQVGAIDCERFEYFERRQRAKQCSSKLVLRHKPRCPNADTPCAERSAQRLEEHWIIDSGPDRIRLFAEGYTGAVGGQLLSREGDPVVAGNYRSPW